MPMRRKLVFWSVFTPLALIAILVIVIMTFDWNRLKPWLNRTVSEAIGRPFAVNGDLVLTWKKPVDESGWRRWVPWPRLSASDIVVGNPEWASEPQFATARELIFLLRPLPLLAKQIALPSIAVDGPSVSLERLADSRNNWTFPTKESKEPSRWELEIGAVELSRGSIALKDAVKKVTLRVDVDTIGDQALYDRTRDGDLPLGAKADTAASAPSAASVPPASKSAQTSPASAASGSEANATGVTGERYGIRWRATGTYNQATINATGKAGAVLSLRDSNRPFPLQADVRVGSTRASIEGTLTDPVHLGALDVRLRLSGDSMSKLYPLTGVVLPDTPPYDTRGRLIATLAKDKSVFRYQDFTGRVGGSDIGGTLTFAQGAPRNKLSGELVSKELRFVDLAPLIGANAKPGEKAASDTPIRQPANKALPVAPFRTERWDQIDADVKLTGKRIVRDESLPITDLSAHVILDNGVLTLNPLNFGIAGGRLISNLRLDGKREPMAATIDMRANHLKLKQLFPTFEPMKTSIGELNGSAKLSATGNSVATLLGSSNGEAKLLIENGTVSKFLLEAMGLNVGSVIVSKLFGDKPVEINCGVSDVTFTDGMARARTFVIDTKDAVIDVSGVIDLKSERLGLTIHPDSKGLRIFSLRSPLYIAGTMKDPRVSPDIGILALRAGGAVALALLAPVATVLPLLDLSPGDDDGQCKRLLAELRKRPTAPPPGKTYRDPKAGASAPAGRGATADAARGPGTGADAQGSTGRGDAGKPTQPAAPAAPAPRSPMYQGG